jgi:hypothetical protein
VKLPRTITKKLLNSVNNLERKITARQLDYIEAAYESEIRFTDQQLKSFLENLNPRTLVIITSDHGEEFGEHGRVGKHGHTVYEELLRVPLIVKGEGIPAGRRVRTRVRSIDIAPSILELAGLPKMKQAEGMSFVPALKARRFWDDEPEDRPVLSEVSGCGKPPCEYSKEPYWSYFTAPCRAYRCPDVPMNTMYGWISGDTKLILLPPFGFPELERAGELYFLTSDAHERRDSFDTHGNYRDRLYADAKKVIEKARASAVVPDSTAPAQEMNPELIEELRALGYID